MNTEERGLLNQFRHRYISLLILRILIFIFQAFILVICCFFVLVNLVGWEIQDFPIGIGTNRIIFKTEYWRVMCFLFSIFSFVAVPSNLKEQIVNLFLAIKYLKEEKRTSAQSEVIKQAKGYISEVDKAVDKFLREKKEEIEPHEKRMVLRRGLIIVGIAGISILTAVLIFKYEWNVPKVASINLLIGYILVMFEAYFYQRELRKSKIVLMEEKIEKECSYNLRREVIWDFIKYIFLHSVFIVLVSSINVVLKVSGNINKPWIGMAIFIIFLNIIGYLFVKKKAVLGDKDILKPYLIMGVLGTGIVTIIFEFVLHGELNDVLVGGIVLLGFLILGEIIASFYRRLKRNIKESTVQFPIGIIFIILNWGISYIFMVWDLKVIENVRFEFFIWMYVELIIIVYGRMFWGMIQMITKAERNL